MRAPEAFPHPPAWSRRLHPRPRRRRLGPGRARYAPRPYRTRDRHLSLPGFWISTSFSKLAHTIHRGMIGAFLNGGIVGSSAIFRNMRNLIRSMWTVGLSPACDLQQRSARPKDGNKTRERVGNGGKGALHNDRTQPSRVAGRGCLRSIRL